MSDHYTIEFAPRTEQQLNLIPKDIKKLIFERIDKLRTNPRPENIEPLRGADRGLFRIRQGDYRIVYSIQDQKLLVLVVRVVFIEKKSIRRSIQNK